MTPGKSPAPLSDFLDRFATDEACAAYLFGIRWPNGFVCTACGPVKAWPLKSRAWTYECSGCGRHQSMTAGTVMHRSKQRLRDWFSLAWLLSTHSNGMSALQLSKQLGLHYRVIWEMAHKMRVAIAARPKERLNGHVEADVFEVQIRTKKAYPSQTAKEVRGEITRLLTMIVAVEVRGRGGSELTYVAGKTPLSTRAGRVRMEILPGAATHESVSQFFADNIAPGTIVMCDGAAVFQNHPGYVIDSRVTGKMSSSIKFPWSNTVISLFKRWCLGVLHGLRPHYPDLYVQEWVFRFNRRFNRKAVFHRLLGLARDVGPVPFDGITGKPRNLFKSPPPRRSPRRRRTASGFRTDGAPPMPKLP